jgi:ABC-2 type transport system permease protein/lipopolysaccharide transport system permease protein
MVVSLIVFSFSLPVLLGAVLYARLPVGLGLLWALGGLLIVVVCCVGQISIMAYLSVSFRDLPPASASALQLLYFFTPIFYPVEVLEQRGVGFLLHLNPFYYLIEVVRYPVLQNALAAAPVYAGAILWTALVWAVALLLAARLDRKIAYTL